VSQTKSSLILIACMIGLAIYLIIVPPDGFDENFAYRVTLPFVLVACAFSTLENLRTRLHMAQLVGALRSLTGQAGKTGKKAPPKVQAEAVDILIKTLRTQSATARKTAAVQLRNFTGQKLGEDAAAWEAWWAENREAFERGES